MLCLGPKKSLTTPRLELTAQGVAYQCSKSSVKTTLLSRRPSFGANIDSSRFKKYLLDQLLRHINARVMIFYIKIIT